MPDETATDIALAAQRRHVFATTTACTCGYQPTTGPDWERHRMEAALAAVVEWRLTGGGP